MNKIIFLYDIINPKGKIYNFLRKEKIEILSKNKNRIYLKNTEIIFKKINCNRANKFKKYENDLILFNPGLRDKVQELKTRCSTPLNTAQCTYSQYDRGLAFYCSSDRYILQKRYWVYADGIMQEFITVSENEENEDFVKRYWINTDTTFYLNKAEAIEEYKRRCNEYLDNWYKKKKEIEEDYNCKLDRVNILILNVEEKLKHPLLIKGGLEDFLYKSMQNKKS